MDRLKVVADFWPRSLTVRLPRLLQSCVVALAFLVIHAIISTLTTPPPYSANKNAGSSVSDNGVTGSREYRFLPQTSQKATEDEIRKYLSGEPLENVDDILKFKHYIGTSESRVNLIDIAQQRHIVNCSNIKEIEITDFLGYGMFKMTYLGRFRGRKVAVKVTRPPLFISDKCLKTVQKLSHGGSLESIKHAIMHSVCRNNNPVLSMLLEVLNYAVHNYPYVVKNYGYCLQISGVPSGLSDPRVLSQDFISVQEYGEQINVTRLTSAPLLERLQHCRDVAHLLELFQNSLIGSVSYTDVKLGHFVLIDGRIKLIDLDEYVTPYERTCGPVSNSNQSVLNAVRVYKRHVPTCPLGITCQNGVCAGLNTKETLVKFIDTFFNEMLSKASTEVDDNRVKEVRTKMNKYQLSAAELRQEFDTLIELLGPKTLI